MVNYNDTDIDDIIRGLGENKKTLFDFLNNIVTTVATTKVGNLDDNELGIPKLPVRTYKELEIFCTEVANMPEFSNYFNKVSESILATSLSRKGFLVRAAITTKKELADVTPEKKINKSWFKSKDEGENKEDLKI
jgi:hypothetical protein